MNLDEQDMIDLCLEMGLPTQQISAFVYSTPKHIMCALVLLHRRLKALEKK